VTVSVEDRARKRRREVERQYWQRLKEALPEERCRLWKALERAMEKYSSVLKDREGLLTETSSLRGQNDELRQLLEQYMTAKVNEELYVPPILTQQLYSPSQEEDRLQ
jgi:dynein regulatry complex protein 1